MEGGSSPGRSTGGKRSKNPVNTNNNDTVNNETIVTPAAVADDTPSFRYIYVLSHQKGASPDSQRCEYRYKHTYMQEKKEFITH